VGSKGERLKNDGEQLYPLAGLRKSLLEFLARGGGAKGEKRGGKDKAADRRGLLARNPGKSVKEGLLTGPTWRRMVKRKKLNRKVTGSEEGGAERGVGSGNRGKAFYPGRERGEDGRVEEEGRGENV